MQPSIRRRTVIARDALPSSLHPVVRRIYAQRGMVSESELSLELKTLLAPQGLLGIHGACDELAAAVTGGARICVVGDYDADGATGVALAVSALRAFGAARVDYLVPSRFTQGYGLSPALADAANEGGAQVLITVDNGIASVSGVARAKALGMRVIITDHHLAGPVLPAADAIVNPNQPGCAFSSKCLAGVGVMFYLLSALRAKLRDAGWFTARPEPRLADWLDLVAVGTVADVVRLDHNNRILVAQGLARIRARRARPGILALLTVAGRAIESVSSTDLGFAVGPRLNAAGRLDDMGLGIECLLSTDDASAMAIARQLDSMNRERREIEAQMRDEALAMVESLTATTVGVALFDPAWHEGVVGLVASRIKDKLNRPTIAFARAQEAGLLKGSARSIAGLHIRDALAAVDAAAPGLLGRYGGHAMAAGLSLAESRLDEFSERFDAVCRAQLDAAALERVLETDGELGAPELVLDTAQALEQAGPWGQGFPEPLFDGTFEVVQGRVVGERHAKYRLRGPDPRRTIEAIHFGGAATLVDGGAVTVAYRLGINRWQGSESAELKIEHLTAP
ncbi:MAG TPA: single-stranded-DNA-specific exonuclease RecJ [Steroidobacteraceae bacterium]|nr:single-stranded-DNA-specific exonuclease RecJ [Steroidobacteraceae bacterium]